MRCSKDPFVARRLAVRPGHFQRVSSEQSREGKLVGNALKANLQLHAIERVTAADIFAGRWFFRHRSIGVKLRRVLALRFLPAADQARLAALRR